MHGQKVMVRDDTQLVASRGGTRVFAGNLSAAVGWQQLKDHLVTLTSRGP